MNQSAVLELALALDCQDAVAQRQREPRSEWAASLALDPDEDRVEIRRQAQANIAFRLSFVSLD